MSHFAKVIDGVVTEVIVSEKDFINSGAVGDEFLWVQTSYNNNFRGKYANVGDTWDGTNFISAQPHPSWILDTSNMWQAPVSMPETDHIRWNEDTLSWDEVTE
jgi:hypothetical protein